MCGSSPLAETGSTALEQIRATRPDAAFLDVAMPGLAGLDVVRALDPAERPHIVFVTAYDRFAIQAFDLYAVDYLLKPFTRERLAASVSRLHERQRSRSARATRSTRCCSRRNRSLPPSDSW